MNNYNFEKRIYKNGMNYCLEISLPNNFNNFFYKVYGNNGFYNYGKYSSFKNTDSNNTLLININKIQYLFISLIITKKNIEYYDFVDMNDIVNNIDSLRNIKMKIERDETKTSSINFKIIDDNQEELDEDSDEEVSSSSSSEDELSVSSSSEESSDNSIKSNILL